MSSKWKISLLFKVFIVIIHFTWIHWTGVRIHIRKKKSYHWSMVKLGLTTWLVDSVYVKRTTFLWLLWLAWFTQFPWPSDKTLIYPGQRRTAGTCWILRISSKFHWNASERPWNMEAVFQPESPSWGLHHAIILVHSKPTRLFVVKWQHQFLASTTMICYCLKRYFYIIFSTFLDIFLLLFKIGYYVEFV